MDREMAKWNKPYVFVPFPRMLYKGTLKSNGSTQVDERIVGSEGEEREAMSEGWSGSTTGATARVEAVQQDIAQAAAEANASATKLSWKAQRERKGREAATASHVPE